MKIEIKSKSSLFHSFIKQVDETLSTIPTTDVEGCDIEDSPMFDTYTSALENLHLKDETGRFLYPVDLTLSIKLIQDEMKGRRND